MDRLKIFYHSFVKTLHFKSKNPTVYGSTSGTTFTKDPNKGVNSGLFKGLLEYILVPALKNLLKSVLVLDTAPCHRKIEIYDIAAEYGFKGMFLPTYSPDLNPIENFGLILKEGYDYIYTSLLL